MDNLFAAYLNQDVFDFHAGIWEAIDAFLEDYPGSEQVASEIEYLLAERVSDEDLRSYCYDGPFALQILPEPMGLTLREFLEEIRSVAIRRNA